VVQTINKQHFTQLIKSASFKELFNELGWDKINLSVPILIDEEKYILNAVAEKRGFVIFVCSADSTGKIPISNIRKKIDQKITKLYYEHLIIYSDKNNFQQIWQLVIREQDKPIVVRETPYFNSQHPELLFQKLSGLFISLDDEEKVTIADVRANVKEQFNTNAEKVTKKFYIEFKAQHTAFLEFIKGIEDKVSQEWYASLMLNRLMFIYFIQKKGFIDNNFNYLSYKLKETKKKKGENKFYSFYRNFLLVLFHQGLGAPERPEKLLKEIGKVPYLNGGLFDVHQIEKEYKKIEIEDKAFEKIFKFFDEYNWHLDTKITATGKDINPDVIGYIFEKYINDRAAMGAYYTKEDITEYIAKNTIIPFLFDEANKGCKDAFENESSLWKMLQENPDRYIYDSFKHGIYFEDVTASGHPEPVEGDLNQSSDSLSLSERVRVRALPPEIQIGIDTTKPNLLERRKDWNKSAPPEFALPTEIWREVVERRNRYFDVKAKIENGEVKAINDFITYNLNIRQFAQDAVHHYEGSDFINVFYKAITKITVLDPTCGSGAFLFAALNILEPLYYECIQRMKVFVEEDDKQSGKKFTQFRKILEEINHHPNEKYYIYKSIILNNLYGVDIMNEAVEIAKLRLFLKLVAEVEVDYEKQNMGLEPLPDIDFNIRSGNSLVGFISLKEIKNVYEEAESSGRLMFEDERSLLKKIEDQAWSVAKLYREFKEKQSIIDTDHSIIKTNKDDAQKRLIELNDLLNKYKAFEYGIDSDDLIQQKKYKGWVNSHQPFHWFAEYYEIVESGGFDVVIGNPPYVEYSKVSKYYRVMNLKTLDCGNLFAYILNKSTFLLSIKGRMGMILPIAVAGTPRMNHLRILLNEYFSNIYISNFADRPSAAFQGVHQMTSILLLDRNDRSNVLSYYSTKFTHWYSESRESLMSNIKYNCSPKDMIWRKYQNPIHYSIIKKISFDQPIANYLSNNHKYKFWVCNATGGYWLRAFNVAQSSAYKIYSVENEKNLFAIMAVLNSNTFYIYWRLVSDARNLTLNDLGNFKCNLEKLINENPDIVTLSMEHQKKLKSTKRYREGKMSYYEYVPSLAFDNVINLDQILAKHYGLSEEELDYIINYDIKFRMGKELEEENV